MTNGVLTAIPAPDGYVVNFDDPQRKGIPETYWLVGIGNFIALLCLLQRVYTKLRISRRFGCDDVLFILSWVCCVTVQALACHLYASGVMGVHAWEISLEKYSYFSLLTMLSSAIYAPGNCMAKVSLLLFYHQLTPQRWFIWATRTMMVVCVSGYVSIFFSLIFQCNPIQRTWDFILEGTCINTAALYIATAVLGVLTDTILLAMPIPVILGLQMPARKKAGVILLFVIGSMTLVTSVVRLILLFPMLVDTDQTWAIVDPFTWICVEANLLVICASSATLRRFFRHVSPKLMGDSTNNTDASSELTELHTFGAGLNKRMNFGKYGISTDMSRFDDGDSDRAFNQLFSHLDVNHQVYGPYKH